MLGISESSLYRLLRGDQLTSVKVGGRTLFERQAIREFIAASRRTSPGSISQATSANDQEAA